MMKKRFGLVFEYMFDIHNERDVAQVSKALSETTGKALWVYTRNSDYRLADRTVSYPKGINATSKALIKNELYMSLKPSVFFSLWGGYRSAQDCDAIMVMYYGIGAFVTATTFKFFKMLQGKKGVVYSKADLGSRKIERDNFLLQDSRLKFFFRFLYHYLMPWAIDYLSVETVEGKKWLVNKLKRSEDKTFVTYNCPALYPIEKISFFDRKKQIIFVGRVSAPEKGVKYLIQAFIKLVKQHSDYNLIIVGPYDESWLQLMESDFSISSYPISFLGNVESKEKLFQLYSESQYFVLPSLFEGSPLSFVEAICCNVIPVCSDVSFVYKEVLEENAKYCLFDSEDTEHLAEKLRFLIDNVSISEKIYSDIEVISSNFSWNTQLASVSKVLSD
ncbi:MULTISPECIES: glycosyltransferase family 4 protein [unclassified Shewanella]|uniref:glycosyltransferase family 4 protein n=1 Tax=unclassified Shewanella TaxID=196818 RepID=UPI0021DB346B|nr:MULTISPECIES: glycosyltransferase family 4 protein [unclassified Shewanella]MCU8034062.1 glycosyltransferase family 4 protein [Shewanella sp. SM71]MCU8095971.1 glycosyltransferase family 4 protein [Shewanella sp. SM102]